MATDATDSKGIPVFIDDTRSDKADDRCIGTCKCGNVLDLTPRYPARTPMVRLKAGKIVACPVCESKT